MRAGPFPEGARQLSTAPVLDVLLVGHRMALDGQGTGRRVGDEPRPVGEPRTQQWVACLRSPGRAFHDGQRKRPVEPH